MAYRYITGISLAVLTVLMSAGCATEEPVPPSVTSTVIVPATATLTATVVRATATQTATVVPSTGTPTPTVTPLPTPTPTASPVAVPTTAPSPTPLPTSTATPDPTIAPTPSSVPTATPTVAPTVLGIGEQISLGELTVFVAGWDTFSGNELAEPRLGNTFVAVDIVTVNSGSAILRVSESLRLSLTDTTEARYVPDPIAGVGVGMGTVDGAVNPGERLRGNVVFEVPADSSGLRLSLDPRVGNVRLVDLGSSPVAGPVPSTLEGERTQIAVQIGEETATGEIMLAVVGWAELPGGFLFVPREGQKSIAVELVISNKGASAISIASLVQTAVKDGDSRRYGSDLLATLVSGGAVDGELVSGRTVRGKVGFTVPVDADGLVFTFDASALVLLC